MTWRVTGPPWLVKFLLAAGARDARTEGTDDYSKTGGRLPTAEERAADQRALEDSTIPRRPISLWRVLTGDWDDTLQRVAEKAALGNILDYLQDDKEHPMEGSRPLNNLPPYVGSANESADQEHDPWRNPAARGQAMVEKVKQRQIIDKYNKEHPMTTQTTATRPSTDPDIDATLNRPATTTPSFADARPTGNVPGLRPNPGMLRALLQPVLFLKLLEPVGAFEVGDVVAAQFWGEGRVMLTPLPMAASRGRIPTTFPANQIHAEIDGPIDRATDPGHQVR